MLGLPEAPDPVNESSLPLRSKLCAIMLSRLETFASSRIEANPEENEAGMEGEGVFKGSDLADPPPPPPASDGMGCWRWRGAD